MKRWHLFELEDFPWVPRVLRDGATDVLDTMFTRLGFYRPVVDRLRDVIAATGERRLVDLGSGGGGGALAMRRALRDAGDTDTTWTLTDRFPNAAAAERVARTGDAGVTYRRTPVDAFAVPAELHGVRTMFSALHHFRPDGVRRLVADAVAGRAPLAFFDVAASPTMRKLPGVVVAPALIVNFAMIFVLTFFLVPLVRPVRASRLCFTYVLPLIPLLYAWDGTVSAVRAYTPDELEAIARDVPGAADYTWTAGRVGTGARGVVFLTGHPRTRAPRV